MHSGSIHGRRWRVAGALLLLAYTAWLLPFAVAGAPGWLPDAHVYLLMAEALSPWGGEASPAARHVLGTSAFPPLYPLLLGLLGGGDAAVARAVGALCLAGAWVALFALARTRDWGRARALLFAALVAVLPVTLLQALEGVSEPLYLLLSLASLAAAARAERRGGGERGAALAVAAAAAALALLTRTLGIALVLAFAAWLVLRRERRRGAWIGVALGPYAVWWLARAALGGTGSYLDALRSRLASYDAEWIPALGQALGEQLAALAVAWTRVFAFHPGPVTQGLAAAIGVLAVAGGVARLRRGELDALYTTAYLGVIALWPFPPQASRLLWPVVPLLLGFACEAAWVLARRQQPARRELAAAGVLALALALGLPSLGLAVGRYLDSRSTDYSAFTHTPRWYLNPLEGARRDARSRRELAQAMAAVENVVPERECVYAVAPLELMWWSGRVSLLPPPGHVDDAVFAENTRECPWFFLSPLVWAPYGTPYYPRERLGAGLEIVTLPSGDAPDRVPVLLARRRPSGGAPVE